MTKLPALKAREVIAILQRAGYEIDHITGSHYILRHRDRYPRIVVPYHSGDLKTAVLRSIIKQSGLTEDEFLALR